MKPEDLVKLPHDVRKSVFECREEIRKNPITRLEIIQSWYRVNIYYPVYIFLLKVLKIMSGK